MIAHPKSDLDEPPVRLRQSGALSKITQSILTLQIMSIYYFKFKQKIYKLYNTSIIFFELHCLNFYLTAIIDFFISKKFSNVIEASGKRCLIMY